MLLTSTTFDGRRVRLAERVSHEGSNVVTILMGSNGCGKSRLFQVICSTFINPFHFNDIRHNLRDVENLISDFEEVSYIIDNDLYLIAREKRTFSGEYNLGNGKYVRFISCYPYEPSELIIDTNSDNKEDVKSLASFFLNDIQERLNSLFITKNSNPTSDIKFPKKILAVTGSPYDKFPFSNSYSINEIKAPYVYLGSRPKRYAGSRFNRGYLSFKFDQLGASFIKLLLKPKQEYVDFTVIFNLLNLSSEFELKLSLNERVRQEDLTLERVLDMVRGVKFMKNKEHEHDLEQGEKEELSQKLLDAFDSVFGGKLDGSDRYFEPIPISCIIDLNSDQEDREYLNSLALLSEFDLIDLEDVKFKKRDTSNSFYLSQASSGELSLLFTMSSIAGEIEDNSIILIDEPELSLNPEWQLKFLPLLNDIFSNYRHCHFIIATHSPNIVSTVPKNNSYIVDLGSPTCDIYESSKYHNRSSDYQLAMLFKSPGFKNEYLISESIDILNKLSKPFSESPEMLTELTERAELLFNLREYLDDEDPVLRLINTIKRALEVVRSEYE
ncbi:hypothetical protein CGK09_02620 [Vibrio parahaemolyticus]|uniref:AAA family ATPase n=3 Tax=Vibrio parahaemolyticus TaxID=670 RepID=UPI0011215920|nr:AAA family ATPase [Vibrio parahaemolyticus]TOB29611.1 hypothetical protein CGK09_02620 [Vibrio parahaemolyticus]